MTSLDLVSLLEELAANAWPPLLTQRLDGWQLGFSEGVTRRANSVLSHEPSRYHEVADKIQWVEECYARWGIPPCYKISPASSPPHLGELLTARGYMSYAHTQVRTALAETVLAVAPTKALFQTHISETFNPAWNTLHGEIAQEDPHTNLIRQQIVARIPQPCAYVTLLNAQQHPVAIGLGVAERGWLGVFGMATLPAFRRQGAATQILRTLAVWGHGRGIHQLYLQVMADNLAAQAVYARLGFQEIYQYYYAVAKEKL